VARRLAQQAGVRLTYVPFNGTAPTVTNLLGDRPWPAVVASDDLVRYADMIRVLALADEARLPAVPARRRSG
jgi:tripartite-type tricarboxylate transporter receptor subunit TctC